MKTTAFVAHSDVPRHDTGWNHPDHQGRLPALTRAVYRDMIALHEPLLEVEAVPASEADLLLAHTPAYVAEVRGAAEAAAALGHPQPFGEHGRISGPSWDAALASVGAALTGAETVRTGQARNAFCATRPPGREVGRDHNHGWGLFNHAAIAARYLRERVGAQRVLLVDWGATPPLGTAQIIAGDAGVRLVSVHAGVLPEGAGGAAFANALSRVLDGALGGWEPQWVLLSLGLDILAADPVGGLGVLPEEVYNLTEIVRERADTWCDGRLVSMLEGGYAAAETGRAAVQQLRSLAGLPPA